MMGDFLEILKFFSVTGEVAIIWVLIALFALACLKIVPEVANYFKERAKAQKEIAAREVEHMKELERREAERNEIMRNTNIVIQNNTESQKVIHEYIKDKEDRYIAALDAHEKMSAEREQHLQTVLNKNSDKIDGINSKVEILLDRD